MARRKKGRISVYVPRKHHNRWRFEVRDGVTGSRSRPSFDTEAEAWKAYHQAVREAAAFEEPTIEELVVQYRQYQIEIYLSGSQGYETWEDEVEEFIKNFKPRKK